MSLLKDKTIKDFSDVLASSEPTPGGGSTAALSGLLAASLTMMVFNLSVGKKSYEALDEAVKAEMTADFEAVKNLQKDLLDLTDEDTKAFNSFMQTMKLPKITEEEKLKRSESMQAASEYALAIPLTVAEKCLYILKHQAVIAEYGNKNALSDVGVGALMALSGLEGAALNVKINLPGIMNEALKQDARTKIKAYSEEAARLSSETLKIVNRRIEKE